MYFGFTTNIPQRLNTAFVLQGHKRWFADQKSIIISVSSYYFAEKGI